MKGVFVWLIAVAGAVLSLPTEPAGAIPEKQMPTAEPLYVPFDPPLGEKLRYRWERTKAEDGSTRISWEVSDYIFERDGDGYRLTVHTVDSGSNELDPTRLAVEKKLADLTSIPFVLRLNGAGEITGLDNADIYWKRIFDAVEEVMLARNSGKEVQPQIREALSAFLKTMRNIPAETRLAMMVESIQPVLEFAETEARVNEPIRFENDGVSPFGGTVDRESYVRLSSVENGTATYSIQTTVLPGGANAAIRAAVAQLAASSKEESAKFEDELSKMNFNQETTARYHVATDTGLTDLFESTETLEVTGAGADKRRITTKQLKRQY